MHLYVVIYSILESSSLGFGVPDLICPLSSPAISILFLETAQTNPQDRCARSRHFGNTSISYPNREICHVISQTGQTSGLAAWTSKDDGRRRTASQSGVPGRMHSSHVRCPMHSWRSVGTLNWWSKRAGTVVGCRCPHCSLLASRPAVHDPQTTVTVAQCSFEHIHSSQTVSGPMR
ncbi:hypothetical protein TPHA_0E03540 [Tetrapisispora phaffii CBS 4417]|uniref:Uncharacterized protein n=1 Tax=Tetrapisispora phaffii (strain ATCC 24235 / CBS 4417 / NBRC 1672 / NRRL Y-8282 / UCD 70-5) TaxID=1071381 RepID=G8BU66_TETPH|nr:hypothetical protein TPHA_0E03540 [Tetrapisispora phaffii CBS 4417]CCE63444.1 hypothetical protein TPHA_0E03540 [Tetrapisispora phaffii CBS 4417]